MEVRKQSVSTVAVGYTSLIRLAVTVDGLTIKLYRDGKLVSEKRRDGGYELSNKTSALKLGGRSYCKICLLRSGVVDDLRIYGKVLAEDEIKLLNSANDTGYSPTSLLGYRPFDGTLEAVTGKFSDDYVLPLVCSMVFSPIIGYSLVKRIPGE
jgi:hypothetical protein